MDEEEEISDENRRCLVKGKNSVKNLLIGMIIIEK